jgi:hypothetical protein
LRGCSIFSMGSNWSFGPNFLGPPCCRCSLGAEPSHVARAVVGHDGRSPFFHLVCVRVPGDAGAGVGLCLSKTRVFEKAALS